MHLGTTCFRRNAIPYSWELKDWEMKKDGKSWDRVPKNSNFGGCDALRSKIKQPLTDQNLCTTQKNHLHKLTKKCNFRGDPAGTLLLWGWVCGDNGSNTRWVGAGSKTAIGLVKVLGFIAHASRQRPWVSPSCTKGGWVVSKPSASTNNFSHCPIKATISFVRKHRNGCKSSLAML